MKKSVWISMIIAGALVLSGLACMAVGHAMDGHKLLADGGRYEGKVIESTYHEDRDFDRIRIDVLSADVELIPSEDGKCRIITRDGENVEYTIRVVEDTLTIRATDKRAWYECLFGCFLEGSALQIALPREEYKSLYVNTVSGDVNINVRYTFTEDVTLTSNSGALGTAAAVGGHLELRTTSGRIAAMGDLNTVTARTTSGKIGFGGQTVDGECTATDVELKTTSGAISVRKATLNSLTVHVGSGAVSLDSLTVTDAIDTETISGAITLLYVTCGSLTAETTSGRIELTDTVAAGHISAKTGSGAIRLERSDAETLYLKTTSGSVKGSLLTPKVFYPDSTSGSVEVPKSTEGGLCEIKTTSGSIHMTLED